MDKDRDNCNGLKTQGTEIRLFRLGEILHPPEDWIPGRKLPMPPGYRIERDSPGFRTVGPGVNPFRTPPPPLVADEVTGRRIRAVLEDAHRADAGCPAEPFENLLHLSLPVRFFEEPVRRKVHRAHDGIVPTESPGCSLSLRDVLKEVEPPQVPVVHVTNLGREPPDVPPVGELELVLDDQPVRLILDWCGECGKRLRIPDEQGAEMDDIAVPNLSCPHPVLQVREPPHPAEPVVEIMDIVRLVIDDQAGEWRGLGHPGQERLVPPEPLFHLPLLGNVAAAPHCPDHSSGLVPEGCLVDVKMEEFSLYVSELIKPSRLAALHDECIGILADLADGIPFRVLGMGLPLTLNEEHISLTRRFIGIDGIEEFFADSPVRKEVSPLRIFCPYEIRDVVAHHPDEAVEVAGLLVGPGKFALNALSFRDVAKRNKAYLPPFE